MRSRFERRRVGSLRGTLLDLVIRPPTDVPALAGRASPAARDVHVADSREAHHAAVTDANRVLLGNVLPRRDRVSGFLVDEPAAARRTTSASHPQAVEQAEPLASYVVRFHSAQPIIMAELSTTAWRLGDAATSGSLDADCSTVSLFRELDLVFDVLERVHRGLRERVTVTVPVADQLEQLGEPVDRVGANVEIPEAVGELSRR